MRIFRDLNVPAVFLQNIVTDLLLGFGVKEVFFEFAEHVRKTYGAEPAFNSMNMSALVDFLLESGIENPIVCSSINKTGFLMTPNQYEYEKTLAEKRFRPMAMSILASGAISPREAIEYVCNLPNIESIVFGASSREHIVQTVEMINSHWNTKTRIPELKMVS
jgi:phosphoribosylformimino-5-aminoimidazole carboxamide ribonucleotide (ProFAR) isomerase